MGVRITRRNAAAAGLAADIQRITHVQSVQRRVARISSERRPE